MIDLTGKVILVTGASSGIGRQCAITLSRLGAAVALTGRDEQKLKETSMMLAGKHQMSLPFDLSSDSNHDELVSKFTQLLGPIDGFVHAAGLQLTQPLRNIKLVDYELLMRVNVFSAFALAKSMTRNSHISVNGASIVFVSSIMGLVSRPALTAYSASKGALLSGAKALALELSKKKTRVNCVLPGMVMTPLMEKHISNLDENQITKRIENYPLGVGTPDDVANVCAFLVSDAARWITGTNIVVDGGYCAQ